jgi:histidine transport system permease protein
LIHTSRVSYRKGDLKLVKSPRAPVNASALNPLRLGIAALIYIAVPLALAAVFRRAEHRWLGYLAVRSY